MEGVFLRFRIRPVFCQTRLSARHRKPRCERPRTSQRHTRPELSLLAFPTRPVCPHICSVVQVDQFRNNRSSALCRRSLLPGRVATVPVLRWRHIRFGPVHQYPERTPAIWARGASRQGDMPRRPSRYRHGIHTPLASTRHITILLQARRDRSTQMASSLELQRTRAASNRTVARYMMKQSTVVERWKSRTTSESCVSTVGKESLGPHAPKAPQHHAWRGQRHFLTCERVIMLTVDISLYRAHDYTNCIENRSGSMSLTSPSRSGRRASVNAGETRARALGYSRRYFWRGRLKRCPKHWASGRQHARLESKPAWRVRSCIPTTLPHWGSAHKVGLFPVAFFLPAPVAPVLCLNTLSN